MVNVKVVPDRVPETSPRTVPSGPPPVTVPETFAPLCVRCQCHMPGPIESNTLPEKVPVRSLGEGVGVGGVDALGDLPPQAAETTATAAISRTSRRVPASTINASETDFILTTSLAARPILTRRTPDTQNVVTNSS